MTGKGFSNNRYEALKEERLASKIRWGTSSSRKAEAAKHYLKAGEYWEKCNTVKDPKDIRYNSEVIGHAIYDYKLAMKYSIDSGEGKLLDAETSLNRLEKQLENVPMISEIRPSDKIYRLDRNDSSNRGSLLLAVFSVSFFIIAFSFSFNITGAIIGSNFNLSNYFLIGFFILGCLFALLFFVRNNHKLKILKH